MRDQGEKMRELIKNMSIGRKFVFSNCAAMIISYLAFIITYMITGNIVGSVFAAFAAASVATAAFAFAFAIFVATVATAKEEIGISFWKAFLPFFVQALIVFVIFRHASYASFLMIGIYGAIIFYLLLESKLISNLKANPPIQIIEKKIQNGAYRSSKVNEKKYLSGFRLWLYKRLVH